MIFQSELTNLDTEFSRLQAQLAVLQQQRNLYSQLQQQTEGYLVGLARLKNQIAETVGGGAIASLKSAVMNLFDPGDHGDNGGNQPIDPTPDTDPTPGADDDEPELLCLNGETGDYLLSDGSTSIEDAETKYPEILSAGDRFWHGATWSTGTVIQQLGDVEYEVQIDGAISTVTLDRPQLHYMPTSLEGQTSDIDSAPPTGQSCDWASPFASPLCSLVWEDAPLLGQHCTITPSAKEDNENKGTSEGERMPYVEFVEVSDKVGYLKVTHSGEIKATYAGFTRKDRAEAWGRLLAVTYDIASGFEVRPAKHLPFKWELKLWGMRMAQIQKLAAEDLTKSPRVEVNSVNPLAREPIVLDSDRVIVGQRIKTKDGQTLEISSTLSADNRFFAKAANEQRQLIELDNVAEFLPTESPAQTAGIEPPAGWGKPQVEAPSQPITSGALVKTLINPQFNIVQYGIVVEISESEAQVGCDGVEILDAETEEAVPPTEPIQPELPIYQRSEGGFEVEQSVKERASILEVGDVVEIVGSRHPQHFGLVGTVEALNHLSELPIAVRTPRGLKGYLRSELKFITQGEKPQSQGLQSGQLLMGDRIITTGKYIGERRVSQLLSAKLGTADKIAAIELAKDLKNLGFDPQLAVTVMAGSELDDASDF